MNAPLPTYTIQERRDRRGTPRYIGDADGIANAEGMVATLLAEGEAPELEIVLDGHTVEIGRLHPGCESPTWCIVGRRRDLR